MSGEVSYPMFGLAAAPETDTACPSVLLHPPGEPLRVSLRRRETHRRSIGAASHGCHHERCAVACVQREV